MAFIPSVEQQAIFDHILASKDMPGQKALGVAALAGTGKTATIIEAIKLIPDCTGIYCAFNKSIAEEVKPKLAGSRVEAKTFHSMGYRTLLDHLKQKHGVAKFNTDETKYKVICAEVIQRHSEDADFKQAVREYAAMLA